MPANKPKRSIDPELRRGVPLTVTLAIAVGLLVLTGVGAVLVMGIYTSTANTFSLVRENIEILIDAAEGKVRDELRPATRQLRYLSGQIAQRRLDPGNRPRLQDLFEGAMSATPQIHSVAFVDTDYAAIVVDKTKWGVSLYHSSMDGNPDVRKVVERATREKTSLWGPPTWIERYGDTFVTLYQPVWRDDLYRGVLIATVSIGDLSQAILGLIPGDGSAIGFVLYGRDRILAHPALIRKTGRQFDEANPLPALADFDDGVLAAMWSDERYPLYIKMRKGIQGHVVDAFGTSYLYVYRELDGYGPEPWLVGGYISRDVIDEERNRLFLMAGMGVGALILSLLSAVLLARNIARPVVRLAAAAAEVSRLKPEKVDPLPGSMFRELNEQARAFNAMLRGLRWLEVYVPRRLVERLMTTGAEGGMTTEARTVTIMFTDIVGFTRYSENRTAAQVAAFLNRHFAMVAEAVEAEGGTVDKFIGDAVMAFWGAPEAQPDHAERAVRAAHRIARDLAALNARRRSEGKPPIRMRIGLHSGPVAVGNIGAPGRMNYTIVGDAVNTANRIEQIAKTVMTPEEDICALASEAVIDALDDNRSEERTATPVGEHAVPGRVEPVRIYRLA
ncbi:MAG: hypothetical protein HOH66_16450 [Rhodospirillaceae bacterium]|nr:hypothetical protein [Rhodospirillaceae bacterium]